MAIQNILTEDYIDPSAPEDYGRGRRCDKCFGKVSRYTPPYWGGTLLCSACSRERVAKGVDPAQFVGKPPKVYAPGRWTKVENLRTLRDRAGYSRTHLGILAEVHPENIAKYEHGRRCEHATAEKLAGALRVPLAVLAGEAEAEAEAKEAGVA